MMLMGHDICLFLFFLEAVSFVRYGAEVTLLCDNVIPHQDKCNRTNWLFGSSEEITEELVTSGKISPSEFAQAKAARLSVTPNCSLVIKNVTAGDAGRYVCQQNRTGKEQGPDAVADLSVVKSEYIFIATHSAKTTFLRQHIITVFKLTLLCSCPPTHMITIFTSNSAEAIQKKAEVAVLGVYIWRV